MLYTSNKNCHDIALDLVYRAQVSIPTFTDHHGRRTKDSLNSKSPPVGACHVAPLADAWCSSAIYQLGHGNPRVPSTSGANYKSERSALPLPRSPTPPGPAGRPGMQSFVLRIRPGFGPGRIPTRFAPNLTHIWLVQSGLERATGVQENQTRVGG
jgi:hypothetical protein